MGRMTRRAPKQDIDEAELEVGGEAHAAAGVTAVAVSMKRAVEQMGVTRSARTLLKLNQADGFDCQGCAWPDPDPGRARDRRVLRERREGGHRGGHEAEDRPGVLRRAPDRASCASGPTTGWASRAGSPSRCTCRPDGSHYEPICWDDAFRMIAGHLDALESPGPGDLLHLGQDLQRGGVRLPAVRARLRHQQPAGLLEHVPRVHVGRAGRGDRHRQGLGQPGGHPRREADRDRRPEPRHQPPADAHRAGEGEAERRAGSSPSTRCGRPGLVRFKNPQKAARRRRRAAPPSPTCTCRSGSTATSRCSRRSARCCWSGTRSTTTSSSGTPPGSRSGPPTSATLDWDVVRRSTGLDRDADRGGRGHVPRLRRDGASAGRWASPSTATPSPRSRSSPTSRSSRATSASPAPASARSAATPTSRATARWGSGSARPDTSSTACATSSASSRRASTASTASPRSRPSATATPRCSSGWAATSCPPPPTPRSPRRPCAGPTLTVHVSTKLNRSHVVHGREALILPALGRSEKDLTGGRPQRVTVEDSMSARARLAGAARARVAAPALRGRHRLLAGPGDARRPARPPVGGRSAPTTPRSASGSRGWSPGCDAYDEKVDRPGGFTLPHPPQDTRTFPTDKGRAIFTVSPTTVLHVPEGHLLLQTFRSHDQFNTTIYGLEDRYRGISGGRRVVFVHPDDIAAFGLEDGSMVDLVSVRRGGHEPTGAGVPGGRLRPAAGVRRGVLPGDEPAGRRWTTPPRAATSRRQVGRGPARAVGRRAAGGARASDAGTVTPSGRGDESKRHVEPEHLS